MAPGEPVHLKRSAAFWALFGRLWITCRLHNTAAMAIWLTSNCSRAALHPARPGGRTAIVATVTTTIHPVRFRLFAALSASLLLMSMPAAPAWAEAYRPRDDAQVLAAVPARATDPRARGLMALRAANRAQPQDLATAVQLAQRYFDEVAAEGDPRYIGYAQSALQPWWQLPDPPVPVRVLRAMLLQFDHRFDAALADLDAALAADPKNAAAWSWRTAILMVQARYGPARQSCTSMAEFSSSTIN